MIKSIGDQFSGDPRKVAEAVVMVSQLDDPPLQLLLGRDVYDAYRTKLRELEESVARWESVTLAIDIDS